MTYVFPVPIRGVTVCIVTPAWQLVLCVSLVTLMMFLVILGDLTVNSCWIRLGRAWDKAIVDFPVVCWIAMIQ